jgi:hypothetical protein
MRISPDVQKLADELIELRCGTHSLANVYEYLLKAYGNASRAKAGFMRFLSGDLPCPMLEAASDWISEEQGNAPGRGHAQRVRGPAGRRNGHSALGANAIELDVELEQLGVRVCPAPGVIISGGGKGGRGQRGGQGEGGTAVQ